MAIWVTPKLSSLPDVGITGAADGEVLTWDGTAGQWVNEAPVAGVTDHGALTGLADDDHTGYLLADGTRTGASSASQPFTVGITLADTTTATTGVIFKGANRWAHNFHHPTGGGAVPAGQNTFIGELAGNFTMGSTATTTTMSSYNVGVGYEALLANTTGYQNAAVGQGALKANTTGYYNAAFGANALRFNTTGYSNMAVGLGALYTNTEGYNNIAIGTQAADGITTGHSNVAIGYQSLRGVTTGYRSVAIGNVALNKATGAENTAIGSNALAVLTSGASNVGVGVAVGLSVTTGSGNVIIGAAAAQKHADGSTNLTDPENSIYIGNSVRAYDNSDSNSIVIGYQAIGAGANTTVLGNTSTTANTIYGAGKFWLRSAATNAIATIGTLAHNSSGTPAAGFGSGLLFQLESSTTEDQDAARVSAVWSDATHATRTADIVFSTVVGAAALAEKLRLTGAGILKFSGTMGDSTKTVGTDAPADWVQIEIGASTYYIPAYAA